MKDFANIKRTDSHKEIVFPGRVYSKESLQSR